MTESWRPIPDTDGWYEASSLGRIRSWKNAPSGRRREPLVLKPIVVMGYEVFTDRSRKQRLRKTHRAVCLAFHGPAPEGRPIVRHLDDSRRNNVPSNLAWGTHKENSADMIRNSGPRTGERAANAKLTWVAVDDIRSSYAAGGVSLSQLARRHSVSKRNVLDIVHHRIWKLNNPPAKAVLG